MRRTLLLLLLAPMVFASNECTFTCKSEIIIVDGEPRLSYDCETVCSCTDVNDETDGIGNGDEETECNPCGPDIINEPRCETPYWYVNFMMYFNGQQIVSPTRGRWANSFSLDANFFTGGSPWRATLAYTRGPSSFAVEEFNSNQYPAVGHSWLTYASPVEGSVSVLIDAHIECEQQWSNYTVFKKDVLMMPSTSILSTEYQSSSTKTGEIIDRTLDCNATTITIDRKVETENSLQASISFSEFSLQTGFKRTTSQRLRHTYEVPSLTKVNIWLDHASDHYTIYSSRYDWLGNLKPKFIEGTFTKNSRFLRYQDSVCTEPSY